MIIGLVKQFIRSPVPERQFGNRHQKYGLNDGLHHAFLLLRREYLKRPLLVSNDYQASNVRS